MDLCLRILTALCKKEGQFGFCLLILLLNPLDSFTEDLLLCPSITQAYIMLTVCQTLCRALELQRWIMCLFTQGAQDLVGETSEETSIVQYDLKKYLMVMIHLQCVRHCTRCFT